MIIDMTKRNLATLIDLIMKALILNACFIFQFQTFTLFWLEAEQGPGPFPKDDKRSEIGPTEAWGTDIIIFDSINRNDSDSRNFWIQTYSTLFLAFNFEF